MTTGTLSNPRRAAQRSTLRRFTDWAIAKRLHVAIAALFVVVVALQQNVAAISTSPFHPDESRWLNRAGYTKAIFHPLSSAWEDRYLTRGQPPGGSYVTGIGLLLQGRDLETNGAWDFRYGAETTVWWNVSRGNMPSWDDVKAARRTNAVLGAVTALALFVIVSRLTNIAGGVVAGLFLAVHPLSVYLSSLGVSDAPFTTMVALTTLASMALAAKPTWGRAALLGLLLGLGAATKLSPLFLALGLAGIGFVLVAEPLLRRIAPLRWLMDRVPGFGTQPGRRLGWMLLCQPVIATGAFVVSYPFLWPDPMGRTRALFAFRRYEMKNQARIWPDASVDSRLEAFRRTWTMLEDRFSATGDMLVTIGGTSSGRGFDVPLALCGLAILVVLAFRRGVTSPTFLALAVAGGQALLIVVGLRVDFDRYYLPIVFLFAIGTGILAGSLWDLVLRVSEAWSRKSVREERPAAAFGPAPASTQRSAD